MFRILMFFKGLFSRKSKANNNVSNEEKPIQENLQTLNEIKESEVFEEWENPSEMDCYTLKDAHYDSLDWYKYSNNKLVFKVLEIENKSLSSNDILEIIDKRCIADDFTILDVRRSLNKLFKQDKIKQSGNEGLGRNKRILWIVK